MPAHANCALIVDDDITLARTLARRLRRDGLTVDTCQSAEVAVELLEAKIYGLLIVDLVLRDGPSGLYVVDAARKLPRARRPQVLMITASNVENLRGVDRSMVKAIVFKPLDLDLFSAYAVATCRGAGSAAESRARS